MNKLFAACLSQNWVRLAPSISLRRSAHVPVRIHELLFGLAMLAGVALSQAAWARTYYIDAERGKDVWSGTIPDRAGQPANDGPWQSLTRVANATLVAGDEVRLRCGQTWSETLRVGQSGTLGNPIKLGSYPADCPDRPTIDGGEAVAAFNWSPLRPGVWKATLPLNLVENGQLAATIAKWRQWSPTNNGSMSFNPSCPGANGGCLDVTTASSARTLVNSPRFVLKGSERYALTYTLLAPSGVRVDAIVRRSGPTDYGDLGLINTTLGSGAWQTQTIEFNATNSSTAARIDFDVYGAGVKVYLRLVRLARVNVVAPVLVTQGSRNLLPARHPNVAMLPLASAAALPENAVDSNSVPITGGIGSTYLTTGMDLRLPSGASITPGLTVTMRSEAWHLDRRTVTAVAGARVDLDAPTRYRFLQGWGYYFSGAAWMVDGADEWHFNSGTNDLVLATPDGRAPLDAVATTTLAVGVDLGGRSYIEVDNLAIRRVVTGVRLESSTALRANNLRIENTAGPAFNIAAAQAPTISNSSAWRIGREAVLGCRPMLTSCAQNATVDACDFRDIGAQNINGEILALPSPIDPAILAGRDAVVSRNRLDSSAGPGIRATGQSQITGNGVTHTCLVLDDCGGIYAGASGSGSIISENVVLHVHGNTDGTSLQATRAVGIYLDDNAQNVSVLSNLIAYADNGIQLHNAANNLVQGNQVFGNRRNQLWLQEQSNVLRPNGDIFGNIISNNLLVPVDESPSLLLQSYLGDTADFASFSGNTYSTLLGTKVVSEITPVSNTLFTFDEWRAAQASGAPRLPDVNGRAVQLDGYTSYSAVGGSQIPNGAMASGLVGWSAWNQTAPKGQLSLAVCGYGPCARYVAGGSTGLVSSPNFSVEAGRWYRVNFDASTSVAGQTITVVPRRGGGGTAGYESLANKVISFVGTPAIKRYAFIFNSRIAVTANDPITNELGARVDFTNIQPGQTLHVANLEMVPLSPIEVGLHLALLANSDPLGVAAVECPDAHDAIAYCGKYVRMIDLQTVGWPRTLAPLSGEILYTREASLMDSDSDTVANSQDACPGTLQGQHVNSSGCALGQQSQ